MPIILLFSRQVYIYIAQYVGVPILSSRQVCLYCLVGRCAYIVHADATIAPLPLL